MKRIILLVLLVLAVLVGRTAWVAREGSIAKPTGDQAKTDKPTEESGEGVKVTHDTNGNVVVHISDEAQGEAGIAVSNPNAAEFSSEVKGYGRVVDPAPLNALLNELLAARVTFDYAQKELERMKVLRTQENVSERAFQTAEEVHLHSRAAMVAVQTRFLPVWGRKLSERVSAYTLPDVNGRKEDPLFDSLANFKSALVRVEFPASQVVDLDSFQGARLVPLTDRAKPVQGRFFDSSPTVDLQMQGQGILVLVEDNASRLAPGAAVTAFMQVSGPLMSGVIIPRDAVLRTEGAAWVYVLNEGGDAFTRLGVSLEHPVENGWFVSRGLTAKSYVVTTGAQFLLSAETRPAQKAD